MLNKPQTYRAFTTPIHLEIPFNVAGFPFSAWFSSRYSCQEPSLFLWAKPMFKQVSLGIYGAILGHHAWEDEGDC